MVHEKPELICVLSEFGKGFPTEQVKMVNMKEDIYIVFLFGRGNAGWTM
jgi:hypothetical protein